MKKILALAALMALTATATAEQSFYSETALVTGLNYSTDEVYVETCSGNVFAFLGIEDWQIGDLASLSMYSNQTSSVEDDEIIGVKYAGSLEQFCELADGRLPE